MAESVPLLQAKNLKFQFKDRVIFEGLDWKVQAGEVVSILGASGSGKSTLLRVLAGLLEPTSGVLEWSFPQTAEENSRFGFVFQEPQLLGWRTVLENVALPLELHTVKTPSQLNSLKVERLEKAREALAQVNLKDAEMLFPHQLSGGMRMRVSIARALASNPRVLFMDEPFSALDEVARFRLQEELRALAEKTGLTVFFVTHSSYEAAFISDRVVLLSNQRRPLNSPSVPAQSTSAFLLDQAVSYPFPRTQNLRTVPAYQEEVLRLLNKMRSETR